jgi:hypothetical protein
VAEDLLRQFCGQELHGFLAIPKGEKMRQRNGKLDKAM